MRIYLLNETEKHHAPTIEDFKRIDAIPFDKVDCSDIPEVTDFSGFRKKHAVHA